MRKRVILRTHDGSRNHLVFEKCRDGFYVFHLESEFNNLRIIGTRDNIEAIDPPGGPMINVNDMHIMPGFVLKKIIIEQGEKPRLLFKSVRNATRRI